MIRIVIAEDHQIVRAGVRQLLSSVRDFEVVAETPDGARVEEMVSESRADVLVLDLTLEHLPGLEALQRALKARPLLKVVVLSMHKGDQFISKALRYGASGYVLKEDSFDELLDAIRSALQGRIYLSSSIPAELRDTRADAEDQFDLLTSREREVLILAAEGLTSEEIGERLFISRRTVETHRANILSKLDLPNQTRLVHFAIRNRLISVG